MNKSWYAVCLLGSTMAVAHHSFAVFDSGKSITVRGTVMDFKWVNPHCWLDLEVKADDGSVQQWGFEGGPPLMLRNQGVSPTSFKAGDDVVVTAHPRKDGTHTGSLMSVTTSSGQPIMAARGGPPPATSAPTPASTGESP